MSKTTREGGGWKYHNVTLLGIKNILDGSGNYRVSLFIIDVVVLLMIVEVKIFCPRERVENIPPLAVVRPGVRGLGRPGGRMTTSRMT